MSQHQIIRGDARRLPLADASVHCVVTSPPYYGLRDYGVDGQIGLEASPEDFIESMRAVFREVGRVLRPDGTLWLNLGDSYTGGGGGNYGSGKSVRSQGGQQVANVRNRAAWLASVGLPPKSLMGMPWRVAFALQEDGWILRSDIIWSKSNPMPESVSDRPSRSHEYIFLMTKSVRYFYDAEAVKEPISAKTLTVKTTPRKGDGTGSTGEKMNAWMEGNGGRYHPESRNKRTVWTVSSESFAGSHFATFPTKLIAPCVLAGTSAKGCCPACGSPWRRLVESDRVPTRPGCNSKVTARPDGDPRSLHQGVVGNRDPLRHVSTTKTVGWEPTCGCGREDRVPCVVFDPFTGSGTTGVVATGAGRRFVGTELNPEYAAMAERRISRPSAPPVMKPHAADKPLPLFGVS